MFLDLGDNEDPQIRIVMTSFLYDDCVETFLFGATSISEALFFIS
jgi:hypothetical protein